MLLRVPNATLRIRFTHTDILSGPQPKEFLRKGDERSPRQKKGQSVIRGERVIKGKRRSAQISDYYAYFLPTIFYSNVFRFDKSYHQTSNQKICKDLEHFIISKVQLVTVLVRNSYNKNKCPYVKFKSMKKIIGRFLNGKNEKGISFKQDDSTHHSAKVHSSSRLCDLRPSDIFPEQFKSIVTLKQIKY